jgi:cytochrome c-type biogenesis protein
MLSLFGKGFGGLRLTERPAATIVGSYLYGGIFALGWTTCIGPILGAVLTLLAAQGGAIVQGALLAFVYALGLGLPLIIIAAFFERLGNGTRFWRLLKGRGWHLSLGSITLDLHSTSIVSGLLLIAMGALLASGQLAAITTAAANSGLAQRILDLEINLNGFIGR